MYTLILILSALLGVLETYLDRHSGMLSNGKRVVIVSTLIQFAFVAPLLGLLVEITMFDWFVVFMVGIYSTLTRIYWWRLMINKNKDLSTIAPMIRLFIPMTAVASVFILGENLNESRIIALVLITVGCVGLGFERKLREIKLDIDLLFAVLIVASSITALNILYKYMSIESYNVLAIFLAVKISQLTSLVLLYDGKDSTQLSLYRPNYFIFARVLQSAGALLYIFALSELELSYAVLIAASIPALFIFIDTVLRHIREKEVVIEKMKVTFVVFIVVGIILNG